MTVGGLTGDLSGSTNAASWEAGGVGQVAIWVGLAAVALEEVAVEALVEVVVPLLRGLLHGPRCNQEDESSNQEVQDDERADADCNGDDDLGDVHLVCLSGMKKARVNGLRIGW